MRADAYVRGRALCRPARPVDSTSSDRDTAYTGSAVSPLLEHHSRFWPVMLFPHIDRSHSVALIGWREGRPVWLKDVVCGSPGRLILTAENLHGRGNIYSWWSWIDIPRRAIESARPSPQTEGLLEVRFREARKSRFLGFMTRGELGGRVFLNLGDACEEWRAKLGLDGAGPQGA